jgi:hypothetical protein
MVGASSTTPIQKGMTPQNPSSLQQYAKSASSGTRRPSIDRDGSTLQPPNGGGAGGPGPGPGSSVASTRNLSASAVSRGGAGGAGSTAGGSFAPSFAPGSFSSELRSQMLSATRSGSRMDVSAFPTVDEDDGEAATEQALTALKDRLNRELKIKEGSENMLEALNTKKAKQAKEQRQRVEAELVASNMRIKELRQRITDTQRMKAVGQPPSTPIRQRNVDPFNGLRSPPSASRSGAGSDNEDSTESPTFALAELLQALEVEGMMPEYYVSRGNQLVDLFKRHPTLKYDLVWSVFGLRMQVMLLSESREVVAAGYRMTRHAISDRASLKRIRDLNTDFLVIRYGGYTPALASVHDPCTDQESDLSTTIEKPTWSANRLSSLFVLSSMLKTVSRRFPELLFVPLSQLQKPQKIDGRPCRPQNTIPTDYDRYALKHWPRF